MKAFLGAVAAIGLVAAGGTAQAAYVEVQNLMTANPFGTQLMVEDVRFADGAVDAPSRPVGRGLNLGDGSVTGFVLVAQTPSGGMAFAVQCNPGPTYARIEIENPWTVSASGGCEVVRRGNLVAGNMIQWE